MKSIRTNLVASLALAVLAIGIVGAAVSTAIIHGRIVASFDNSLRTKAEAIASLIEFDDGLIELDERDEALGEFGSKTGASHFELRDALGKTIDRSTSLDAPLQHNLPRNVSFEAHSIVLPNGAAGRLVMLPIVIAPDNDDSDTLAQPPREALPEDTPTAWVLVAAESGAIGKSVREIAWVLCASTLLVMLAMICLIPGIVRRGMRPLDEMANRTARIDVNNLVERFPTDQLPSELLPIATQLNASLDRLHSGFERERLFASSAAHELRTPLAAIRANAEVALKWPNPNQVEPTLKNIFTSAQRMQSLVERLLQFARLGDGVQAGPFELVSLPEVIEECIAAVQPLLQERRIEIDRNLPGPCMVLSDPHLLRPMIANLIHNAAQHATAETTVQVLCPRGSSELSIVNRTSDLEPADLAHMFDPLWTRSTDRSAGNAGLGLALVAVYARALSINIQPAMANGEFTLQLSFPHERPSR